MKNIISLPHTKGTRIFRGGYATGVLAMARAWLARSKRNRCALVSIGSEITTQARLNVYRNGHVIRFNDLKKINLP